MLTGGTGGTVDLLMNSETVIQMMQAKSQATGRSSAGRPAGGQEEDLVEDMGERIEAMVEELAGVDSFDMQEDVDDPRVGKDGGSGRGVSSISLLEDALSKVEDARDALSRAVDEARVDSDLRTSAPAFVPGQLWTGSQMSSFVD